VEKDCIALLAASPLEREGDEIAEPLLRHEVLGREEPVVARQVDLGAERHRLAQQPGPEPAGDGGLDRLLEEHPHVCPVARARPLQTHRDANVVAHLEERQHVERPGALVEVASQK